MEANKLFYGDNLDVLRRHIGDESDACFGGTSFRNKVVWIPTDAVGVAGLPAISRRAPLAGQMLSYPASGRTNMGLRKAPRSESAAEQQGLPGIAKAQVRYKQRR